jgi:heptosyltransferase II
MWSQLEKHAATGHTWSLTHASTHNPPSPPTAHRVLVFLPSWLGDTVMATPTIDLIRQASPKSTLVCLGRDGAKHLLAGLDWIDEVIEADGRSVMAPAKIAGKLRAYKFSAALILPNSFASALAIRLAGIDYRVGYDRDGRGGMLTHRLEPARRLPPHSGYAPVSAVDYYYKLGQKLISALGWELPAGAKPTLHLAATEADKRHAEEILRVGGIKPGEAFALINPGANNPAKRWPVERFAALVHHLISVHKLKVALNGAPSELPLINTIHLAVTLNHPEDENMLVDLPKLGGTIGSLKAIIAQSRIVITNDTGPRHFAAAFERPCVTLFGPTDHRWTTLPKLELSPGITREEIVVADPSLHESEIADDHPERCRMDKITVDEVIKRVDRLLIASR